MGATDATLVLLINRILKPEAATSTGDVVQCIAN